MYEQLRKRKVDMCCLQEVRWRGQGGRFVGFKSRIYNPWWFGNNGEMGIEILVKEKLHEKLVEVRRKNDRMIAMVLVFEEEVITVTCAYAA